MNCTDLGTYHGDSYWYIVGRPLPPPQPGTHWLHPHVRGTPPAYPQPDWDHEDSHLAWCWSEGGEA